MVIWTLINGPFINVVLPLLVKFFAGTARLVICGLYWTQHGACLLRVLRELGCDLLGVRCMLLSAISWFQWPKRTRNKSRTLWEGSYCEPHTGGMMPRATLGLYGTRKCVRWREPSSSSEMHSWAPAMDFSCSQLSLLASCCHPSSWFYSMGEGSPSGDQAWPQTGAADSESSAERRACRGVGVWGAR